MIIEMSKENSERLLRGFKYLNKVVQNYFASQNNSNNNSTSAGKKFINALLLTPVIVPTAITLSLVGCTYLCLNAVKAQDDDFTLSKVTKSAVRYLIYLAAFVVLSTCIVLNLAISLIPFLTFRAINKGIFKESNAPDIINTTDAPGQAQPTNTILTDSEYKKHINDALNKLNSSTEPRESINNENEELNQILISPTQPTVQVISLNTGNPDQVNETIIVNDINGHNIRNGKVVAQLQEDETKARAVFIGTADNRQGSLATIFQLGCGTVENGVDITFRASLRTGVAKPEAMNQLLQSKVVQEILSDCAVEMPSIIQVHSN